MSQHQSTNIESGQIFQMAGMIAEAKIRGICLPKLAESTIGVQGVNQAIMVKVPEINMLLQHSPAQHQELLENRGARCLSGHSAAETGLKQLKQLDH